MASARVRPRTGTVSLRDAAARAGLQPQLSDLLEKIPHRKVTIEPRRPFRDIGNEADEVIFVYSGILAKFKTDGSGRRQIVALRFPGEGILPRDAPAQYGIQAIVRTEAAIGSGKDLYALAEANPELQRLFRRRLQRNEEVSYEWLVNCGRRDSTTRVAHFLCETAVRMRTDKRKLVNPFTQQQIADITGQTSVNVNRVLADLERQGLIKRHGREIDFLDWAEIRRIGNFSEAYLSA